MARFWTLPSGRVRVPATGRFSRRVTPSASCRVGSSRPDALLLLALAPHAAVTRGAGLGAGLSV